jgi:hypothetical protein
MPPSRSSYWSLTRSPRYSVLFAAPLLLCYELLAFVLSGDTIAGVRNGADVLLKSLFLTLGGRHGLALFTALIIGIGGYLVWRDRQGGALRPRFFGFMLLESILYAFLLGTIASRLTGLLLGGLHLSAAAGGGGGGALAQFDVPTQIMISLGAGIYEELLFRVIVVSGIAWFGRKLLGWRPVPSAVLATVVGALIFSAFHYIGPYGDRLELGSFTFRAIAGLLFSALYLLRGFGVAAWSHALYDVILTVLR